MQRREAAPRFAPTLRRSSPRGCWPSGLSSAGASRAAPREWICQSLPANIQENQSEDGGEFPLCSRSLSLAGMPVVLS